MRVLTRARLGPAMLGRTPEMRRLHGWGSTVGEATPGPLSGHAVQERRVHEDTTSVKPGRNAPQRMEA